MRTYSGVQDSKMRNLKIKNESGILTIEKPKPILFRPKDEMMIIISDEEHNSQNMFLTKSNLIKLRDFLDEITK